MGNYIGLTQVVKGHHVYRMYFTEPTETGADYIVYSNGRLVASVPDDVFAVLNDLTTDDPAVYNAAKDHFGVNSGSALYQPTFAKEDHNELN